MERIKPWLGRCLNSPRISYIMKFKEFNDVELILKDIKAGITDLDDLVDEKKSKNKQYIKTKLDFEKRKERVRKAGIASAQGSGFDQLLP
jgi:hypothetical protein